MAHLHAEQTAVIDAPPEAVYEVLSDYHNHHPHILPKANFSDLRVSQGGKGAGTVFQVLTRFMGVERELQMRVTEPEPGQVLAETDERSGLVTTFTLTPLSNGQQTSLRIATDWEAAPGMMGVVERLVTPRAMRQIYRAELAQLNDYLARKEQ